MSSSTGLGLLDVMILEAIEVAGARHDRPYLKTQRTLDVLHDRTGIGPNQAYESLCDMARRYVARLPLVDFHGNYGSPDYGRDPDLLRVDRPRGTGFTVTVVSPRASRYE